MTPAELQTERRYRIDERLGIMCGAGQPTQEQRDQATKEADDWLHQYNEQTQRDRDLMEHKKHFGGGK